MEWGRWIHAMSARLRAIVRWRRVEEELDDELSFHMAMQTADRLNRGDADRDAGRRSRLALGGLDQTKEQCRDARPLRWAHDLAQDLRYAYRSLRRAPTFAAVAIATLALGIGANAAMFSVLNTHLFRPLPYPVSDRLVRVYRTSIHSQSWPHSAPNYLDYRARNTVFERLVAFNFLRQSLVEEGQAAEALSGSSVTADFFPALGVPPALGRWFTTEEDRPGADPVAVLSDGFWRRRFGGDSHIVGRTLRLAGAGGSAVLVKVVGVMPPGFEHPLLWGQVDLWRPIAFTPEQQKARNNNYLQLFGRLKPGVAIAQGEQTMVSLAANLSRETSFNKDESLRLEPLQRSMSDEVGRTAMWFTFGLAGFVLLIACANLANLQLVRTASRVREHVIRASLGAGRARLLRQSLTESLVIACVGGTAGLVVAFGVVDFINRRLFSELPGARVTLDLTVFGFALITSIVTGIVFGTAPAWLASRPDVNQALKDQPRGSSTSSQHRLRHALIVGEIAFTLVLLTGAGLFLRGLERFSRIDPGWRVDGLLMAQFGIRGPNYSTPAQRMSFFELLEGRLRALPGVQAVALSTSQPIGGLNSSGPVVAEGQAEPEPGHYAEVFFEQVSPGYFETLGVRLLAGRLFNAADTADRPAVAIVNDAMVRRFWPNESPLGKRFSVPITISGANPTRNWMEVVGVVNDVGFPGSLSEPYTRLEAFRPLAQGPPIGVSITLRTATPPDALTDSLRRVVADVMPLSPVNRIRTAQALVDQSLGRISLLATLLGVFAALGVALAAIGVYGVTSYSVVQRTGELGIRIALGAQARDVLKLVLTQGAVLVFAGIVIGLAGAFAVARLLVSVIPTLPTRDPAALAAFTLALVTIALVACYVPARRATRVDPLIALRHE